jgi:subtilisin family serine protease
MPTRRGDPRPAGALALVAATVAGALVVVGNGGGGSAAPVVEAPPSSWQGLAGAARPRVSVGQRVFVVLRAASLSDRVAAAGGVASDGQERAWSNAARAKQKQLITKLGLEGVLIRPQFSYTRVLNGFSAAVDARGLAVLERSPEVAGVYPDRVAYPASVSSQLLARVAGSSGLALSIHGIAGRGVTIALLDTGVDRAQPYLRGRVLSGIDVVGGAPNADAAPKPDDPEVVEEHGTEMAGILVGAGGPAGVQGVATGASVLPIRVAGWQADASGNWSVYARTDEIVAGLEKAVDPNGDGDAHDAARIALVALAEPYAAFPDDPLARAAAGALRLDTLVVAPAGNDGAAGPAYGSVSAPGGALAALTVGAADLRPSAADVRLVARTGLKVLLDGTAPLGGVVSPGSPVVGRVAVPRVPASRPVSLDDFFDARGYSRVAGQVALVPAGVDPRGAATAAARAGARAVLLYGPRLPSGALGLDEDVSVPVVSIPPADARTLRAAVGSRIGADITIASTAESVNPDHGHVASFSSTGLTFDGTVKPDLVAPGVGVPTSVPGANPDGSPRFATVNGSSAAAAVVAGAAALLAEARPSVDSAGLKALLVGTARPLAGDSVAAQGSGLVDVARAAAAEVVASPATLSLGRASGRGWHATQTITLRNVSTRPLRVRLAPGQIGEGAAAIRIVARPRALVLERGASADVQVTATVGSTPIGGLPADGAIRVGVQGGSPIRIPWLVAFGRPPAALVGPLRLSVQAFKATDPSPALLTFAAGLVAGDRIVPVSLLDVRLFSPVRGELGLLARVRDVLPGSYAFGLTGRGPSGAPLPPGPYTLRVIAYPTDGGPTTIRTVRFTIR